MLDRKRELRHIVMSQQFDRELLRSLFARALHFRGGRNGMNFSGRTLITLFYEASTRTRLSFERAMLLLGGNCIGTENAKEFSSAVKGESIEDTARVISEYGDVIVLRHTDDYAAAKMAQYASIPVINAGCGRIGQHPTQALTDLFTIEDHRGTINGVNIAVVGDLKNGRTVRSLVYLLGKYEGVKVTFVSPEELRVESDIPEYLTRHGVAYRETDSLAEVIETVDVVYTTRVQRERIEGLEEEKFAYLQRAYRIDAPLAHRMREDAIIMHPLPRNDELDQSVDALPQARYFEQARNGLYIRMALLEYVLAA